MGLCPVPNLLARQLPDQLDRRVEGLVECDPRTRGDCRPPFRLVAVHFRKMPVHRCCPCKFAEVQPDVRHKSISSSTDGTSDTDPAESCSMLRRDDGFYSTTVSSACFADENTRYYRPMEFRARCCNVSAAAGGAPHSMPSAFERDILGRKGEEFGVFYEITRLRDVADD